MENYIPPYTITDEMLELVTSITKKICKLDNYNSFNKMPVLRKNNRIKSIHSSLAIEANSLSLNQVKDVIDGKVVLGPAKEIQEVKNAYAAYNEIKNVDPYSVKDLKRIHGIMTKDIVFESGSFRKGNEGVFDENGNCIHICPPPEQVDYLIKGLFSWMKSNKNKINPLILSSIFHYEFVFIHPFSDGNGRMARLWQNVILTNWEEIFEYIPIETEIMKYQNDYYKAISKCNLSGESTEFILFMLKMIDEVLDGILVNIKTNSNYTTPYVNKIYNIMEPGVTYSARELMDKMNMKSRLSLRDNYITPAIKSGFIMMTNPDSPTSKNQRYFRD